MKRWQAALLHGGLLLLGLLVFAQVRGFQFVTSDDRDLIVHNRTVTAWLAAPLLDRLLTLEFGYAIPVTVASFALDSALGGGAPNPGWMHAVNLLLHLGCAALCLRILLRLTAPLPALCGALLFLVHPAQAEAVGFVTQRKDLLVALFALLALSRLCAGRGTALGLGALALLAGLSKPSGVFVGPLLGLLWLLFRRQEAPLTRRDYGAAVALAVLGGALLVLNLAIAQRTQMALAQGPMSAGLRVTLVGSTLRHYLGVLLLPLDLAPKVPRPVAPEWGWLALALAAALLWALLLARALRKGHLRGALLLLWLAGAYAPISNVLLVSRYAADSFLYLPLFGAALALALGMEQALRAPRLLRPVLGAVVLLWLSGLAVLCHGQVAVWRDEETLFAYLYRLFPESNEAMREYAELLERGGRREEALALRMDYFTRALLAQPQALGPRLWLFRLHLERGDVTSARRVLEETPEPLRGHPGYREARRRLPGP